MALPGGLRLGADAGVRLFPLVVNGADMGAVLGHPIEIDAARMLTGPLALDLPAPVSAGAVEAAVMDRLAGSFLFVVAAGDGAFAYVDASATMGLVYDPERALAASSAELLLGADYEVRLDHSLIREFGADRDGWFTTGLTAHRGVYRLLPNHRLDLSGFAAARHWPPSMPAYVSDPEGVVRAIGEDIGRSTQAALAEGACLQCLTGGNETRALLAANRAQEGKLEFVTLGVPGAEMDAYLAGRLVALGGLRHRVLPPVTASAEQMARWRRGAGHGQSGMNAVYHPTVGPLSGKVLIGGLGGEVGRGFLWPADLSEHTAITPEFLLTRLKLPHHPVLLPRVEAWLAGLPEGLDPWQVLDLAYLELRNGPWAFGQGYARQGPRDLHPLISRRQFTRMWSLPPAFRRSPGFLSLLTKQFWPELAAVPINSYGDWRDSLALIRKLWRRPDRAWRKLRQIVRHRTGL
ncbi:hypothetical protein OKA06_05190 [Novosphingobium sp. MW5]|nr:hypothetical protein [Novosphingobium sp. MW5]